VPPQKPSSESTKHRKNRQIPGSFVDSDRVRVQLIARSRRQRGDRRCQTNIQQCQAWSNGRLTGQNGRQQANDWA
jgi:hypothetical protein